jgi:hypothetical protein
LISEGVLGQHLGASRCRAERVIADGQAFAGILNAKTARAVHSIRRTKATLIDRRTKNPRAVQLLLGNSKLESTARYLDTLESKPTMRLKSRSKRQSELTKRAVEVPPACAWRNCDAVRPSPRNYRQQCKLFKGVEPPDG